MNWSRTFDVLSFQQRQCPNPKALSARVGEHWASYSTQTCIDLRNQYSAMLLGLGMQKGDKLVMLPSLARLEWVLLDAGAQQIGVVVVPVHVTFSPEQFKHVVEECEARVCFFLDEGDKNKFLPHVADSIQGFVLQGSKSDKASLENLLSQTDPVDEAQLEQLSEAISKEDLSSIMYTSGTTGIPKGVMLTHDNICSNIKAVMTLLPFTHLKRAISFLPYSHIFERTSIYAYMVTGASLYFPGDRDLILESFKEVKPHYFTAVPRILEKMVEALNLWKAEQNVLVRRTVNWALSLGRRYKEGAKLRPWFWMQRQIAKMLVFSRFRKGSGGHVEAIMTGAAYLQPEISRIFAAAGIKVREGYGMTETSPIITMNRFSPGMSRLGTVGLPIPGVEVKIDEPNEEGEGEIIVRGPNVMKGYYKRPEETARVLSPDGWLRTGDVGKFVHRNFLQITDRRKDIFKTSAGKYIAPLVLENHLHKSNFIEQSMIVGFQRPFITALIKPNFDMLRNWANEQKIHWTSPEYMVLNVKVKAKIQEEMDRLNESLPNFQKIRKFHLFHQELNPESGLVTNTLKLMRARVLEFFNKEVEIMYHK